MILYNVYPNRRAAEADLPMVRALRSTVQQLSGPKTIEGEIDDDGK